MNTQANVQTIRNFYAAFGSGDVQTIVDGLTDDVHWYSHFTEDVPWGGDFSGKANVPGFFSAIYNNVDVNLFSADEFVAEGDSVISMGRVGATSQAAGKIDETPWVFIWKFDGDKVCSYEQYSKPTFGEIFVS